jgi:hypothetical protein
MEPGQPMSAKVECCEGTKESLNKSEVTKNVCFCHCLERVTRAFVVLRLELLWGNGKQKQPRSTKGECCEVGNRGFKARLGSLLFGRNDKLSMRL